MANVLTTGAWLSAPTKKPSFFSRLLRAQMQARQRHADRLVAQYLAVHGNIAGTGPALAPGLTTAMVNICDATDCPGTHAGVATGTGVVNLVTVSITGYTYQSMLTHVAPATLPFNDISVTLRTNL